MLVAQVRHVRDRRGKQPHPLPLSEASLIWAFGRDETAVKAGNPVALGTCDQAYGGCLDGGIARPTIRERRAAGTGASGTVTRPQRPPSTASHAVIVPYIGAVRRLARIGSGLSREVSPGIVSGAGAALRANLTLGRGVFTRTSVALPSTSFDRFALGNDPGAFTLRTRSSTGRLRTRVR